jgi:hypothetical protein
MINKRANKARRRQVTKGVWQHRMRLVKEPAVQQFEQRATIRYARSKPPGPTVLMRLLLSNVGDAAPFAAGLGFGERSGGIWALARCSRDESDELHAARRAMWSARRGEASQCASVGRLCVMQALPSTATVRSCHPHLYHGTVAELLHVRLGALESGPDSRQTAIMWRPHRQPRMQYSVRV